MPATNAKTWREYTQAVVDRAGSDLAVGKFLGFSDGSRVGAWRKGTDRGSELACIKLARWMGDDPLEVLRIAGYHEMADLIANIVVMAPPEASNIKSQLKSLRDMINAALTTATAGEEEQYDRRSRTTVGTRGAYQGGREAVQPNLPARHLEQRDRLVEGQGQDRGTGVRPGRNPRKSRG